MDTRYLDAEIERRRAVIDRLTASRDALEALEPQSPQAAVVDHAISCWGGDADKAWAWLVRPHWVFRGRSPLEMILAGDHAAVNEEIFRIEYGVYA